jgi:beta-lactamase superfamily II metal-dependent hydrolase
MRGTRGLAAFLLLIVTAAAATAQRNGEATSSVPAVERQPYDTRAFMAKLTLTEAETNGRLLVAQGCANCHGGNARQPGPPLGSQMLADRGEAFIREKIMKGSPLMPGFQYTLRPAQVDDIVAFLRTSAPAAQSRSAGTLDIYVIDVEGGNATLFVSPSRQSLLIDTGNGGAGAARDAGRIVEAARAAGLTQIDHLVISHWHGDHYGGLTELASRMPIRHFIDHGPTVQKGAASEEYLRTTYPALYAKAKRTVVKPGDTIAMAGLDVRVVTSNGAVIRTPLTGAGDANALCGAPITEHNAVPEDPESVGLHVSFGKFRTMHLGDLTSDKEWELVCPVNRIGTIDVLLGLHHGQDTSSPVPFVHAVRPRAAVMNNGTRKGGLPAVMKVLYSSPGFEDLWQMHFSLLSGQEYSAPGLFIANGVDDPPDALPAAPMSPPARGSNAPPPPVHGGKAYWIKVSAQEDGTFTVTNTRNGFSKVYRP